MKLTLRSLILVGTGSLVAMLGISAQAQIEKKYPLSIQCKATIETVTAGVDSGDRSYDRVEVPQSQQTQFIFDGPVGVNFNGSGINYSVGYNWKKEIILNVGNSSSGATARVIMPLAPKLGKNASLSLTLNDSQSVELKCEIVKTPATPVIEGDPDLN